MKRFYIKALIERFREIEREREKIEEKNIIFYPPSILIILSLFLYFLSFPSIFSPLLFL